MCVIPVEFVRAKGGGEARFPPYVGQFRHRPLRVAAKFVWRSCSCRLHLVQSSRQPSTPDSSQSIALMDLPDGYQVYIKEHFEEQMQQQQQQITALVAQRKTDMDLSEKRCAKLDAKVRQLEAWKRKSLAAAAR